MELVIYCNDDIDLIEVDDVDIAEELKEFQLNIKPGESRKLEYKTELEVRGNASYVFIEFDADVNQPRIKICGVILTAEQSKQIIAELVERNKIQEDK